VVGIIFDALFAGLDDLHSAVGTTRWGSNRRASRLTRTCWRWSAQVNNCASVSTNVTHVDGGTPARRIGFHDHP